MEDKRRRIGILLISLGLLIILIVVFLFLTRKDDDRPIITPDGEENLPEIIIEETTPSDIQRNYQQYDISKEAEHVFNSTDLSKRARVFVERFGSYSNQSDYGNFKDLELYMTKSFAAWSSSYVDKLRENAPNYQSYYGISTVAIQTELKSFDDNLGVAEIDVLTERTETTSGLDQDKYRQKISLKFLKVGRDWLVDAAYWEKR